MSEIMPDYIDPGTSTNPTIVVQTDTPKRPPMMPGHALAMLAAMGALGDLSAKHIRTRPKNYGYRGVGAPPMPTGPNRCSCGSGKRPKKCCKRKQKS